MKEKKPDPDAAHPPAGGISPQSTDPERAHAAAAGSLQDGLAELAILAGQAFEDRRLGECLALARAMLKIDPRHKDALEIQARVRSDLHRAILKVRALLGQTKRMDDATWERAHALLSEILDVDPDNAEARALWPDVEFHPSTPAVGFSEWNAGDAGDPRRSPSRRSTIVLLLLALIVVGGAIQYGGTFLRSMGVAAGRTSESTGIHGEGAGGEEAAAAADAGVYGIENVNGSRPGRIALFVVPARGVEMSVDGGNYGPVPVHIDLAPGRHTLAFRADGYEPYAESTDISAGEQDIVTILLTPSTPEGEPASAALEPRSTNQAAGPNESNELFRGPRADSPDPDSAPRSPAPEVRQVTLQINARPWAEVFLDGSEMRPLGQTPLGDVRVPARSVLVFRNPGFPDKRYQVGDDDETVQVVFP